LIGRNSGKCLRTPPGEVFVKGIIKGLCEQGQTFRFGLFYGKSGGDATIVLSHLSELSGDFTWEFDAVLNRRIWLERFSLDFFEKIGSCP
jgi:hypothetical protein